MKHRIIFHVSPVRRKSLIVLFIVVYEAPHREPKLCLIFRLNRDRFSIYVVIFSISYFLPFPLTVPSPISYLVYPITFIAIPSPDPFLR